MVRHIQGLKVLLIEELRDLDAFALAALVAVGFAQISVVGRASLSAILR